MSLQASHGQKFFDHFKIGQNDYVKVQGDYLLHRAAEADFLRMEKAAKEEGINLTIASSLRDFDHQLSIWNGKASGERVIRDDDEMIVNIMDLSKEEIMRAIMRFSAVPGLSRHHFGTDIDLFDKEAIAPGVKLSLIASEYESDGPFTNLSQWLIENCEDYGFYIPYSHDNGKLAREPWHISHKATVQEHTEKMTFDFMLPLYEQFTEKEFQLVEQVKVHLNEIIADYVTPY